MTDVTLKKDFFKRPNRMTHSFGETARINDPLSQNTFTVRAPLPPERRGMYGVNTQNYGNHETFSPPRSPITKPNGMQASIAGPNLDLAEAMGAPQPVSVKHRNNFLKTEK